MRRDGGDRARTGIGRRRGAASCLLAVVAALALVAVVRGQGRDAPTSALAASQAAQAAPRSLLRVAAYNIKHGRGMDGRVDLPRIAEVLRSLDADVITLQEVDDRTERTAGVDQVAVLADLLGYRGFHGPHRPYQGGHYGNAALTRLPVREAVTHAIPPASGSELAVLEVSVEAEGGQPVSVVSVHLAGSVDERLAQADALTRLFADRPRPVVLAGDSNGRPGGAVLRRLATDWAAVAKEEPSETYPSDAPDREIDFVMVRAADDIEVVEHHVVAEALASDHRPIVATLRLEVGWRPAPHPRHSGSFGKERR